MSDETVCEVAAREAVFGHLPDPNCDECSDPLSMHKHDDAGGCRESGCSCSGFSSAEYAALDGAIPGVAAALARERTAREAAEKENTRFLELLAGIAAEHDSERRHYTRDWPEQAEANFGKLTRKPGEFAVPPPCPCRICVAVLSATSDKHANRNPEPTP